MEHLHHFGLRQDPFQNEPDLRFYFDSVSHSAPQRRIDRGLRQSKGLCVLTGDAGTGKTLIARRLLESLEEEVFDAQLMLLMPGATDAQSVLGRYARMVGVDEAKTDRPALLGQIYERLAIVREEGRHSVLMLDDAHLLDRESLAEIGGLLNLEYEDRRLVSLLLVGLPQLDDTINNESSLGQRVDVRTRIEPLDETNTMAYLLHRLDCAGGDATTLPQAAMTSLYKFGCGRPRLLNTLADNALYEAFLGGRTQLSDADVERAAADLGIGARANVTTPAVEASPMTMELDEVCAPEMPSPSPLAGDMSAPTGSPEVELDDFLGEETSGSSDLTTLMPEPSSPGNSSSSLGEPIDAMDDIWDESSSDQSFSGFDEQDDDLSAGSAATRIAFDEELEDAPFVDEAEVVKTQPVDGSEDALGDEVDDLFVELIDD